MQVREACAKKRREASERRKGSSGLRLELVGEDKAAGILAIFGFAVSETEIN